MSFKLVICGPKHSGKSVLIEGLIANLNRNSFAVFAANPDDEGRWTYQHPESATLRRKGEFTISTAEYYASTIKHTTIAPIVLVDTGGETSPENRLIMAQCDAAIILSHSVAAIDEWQDFCGSLGLKVLATVYSDYQGSADLPDVQPMVIHHLERGDSSVAQRGTLLRLLSMIKRIANIQLLGQSNPEAIEQAVATGLFDLDQLARILDLPRNDLDQYMWQPKRDGARLVTLLRRSKATKSEVRINGGGPGWLYAMLATIFSNAKHLYFNSLKGYIEIVRNKPTGTGFCPDGRFFVQRLTPGRTLVYLLPTRSDGIMDCSLLKDWLPPSICSSQEIVLSARANWMVGALTLSYLKHSVASYQVNTGAIVVNSPNPTQIGIIRPEAAIKRAVLKCNAEHSRVMQTKTD